MSSDPAFFALEDTWRDAIDAVLTAHGWPSTAEVTRLGPLVRALSASYNESGAAPGETAMAARLGFSFVRDMPKSAGAVRELILSGALRMPKDRALRVLDVGAGLGATTWGVARALDGAGEKGAIDATWVDADPSALRIATELCRAQHERTGNIELRVQTRTGSTPPPGAQRFDLILLGQVLSELDRTAEPEARIARHVATIRGLLDDALAPDGALVIIEPALRDRTRHLHAVRDALVAAGACGIFAPCLHADACPALAHAGDWCHEDLAVDLPEWLAPVARAAGLRWQGLTFSYLVLRKDALTLRDAMPAGVRLRVVSDALVSKGKRDAFLCGRVSDAPAMRLRAQRLDRHESEENSPWSELSRGDLFAFPGGISQPSPASPLRVLKDTKIDVPWGRK